MVIEVVSKGTVTIDMVIRKDIYERYCVSAQELFIIEKDQYTLYSSAEGEGLIKSSVIKFHFLVMLACRKIKLI